jgi:hypothetical protein
MIFELPQSGFWTISEVMGEYHTTQEERRENKTSVVIRNGIDRPSAYWKEENRMNPAETMQQKGSCEEKDTRNLGASKANTESRSIWGKDLQMCRCVQ